MWAIETERIAKAVGSDRQLFAGLSFAVAPGELVAITGESGVGKSTLLNLLAGLDDAEAGEIRIEGVALGPLNDEARTKLRPERIGFVFQTFHILPYLTLEQNVALPLALISPTVPRPRHVRGRCWPRSGSAIADATTRATCPAANSNGSRSRGRSCTDRR